MDAAFRLASRAVGAKFPRTELVQDRFRNDRTRRIAGAEKQHVVRSIAHDTSHLTGQPHEAAVGAGSACCGTQQALACATRASRSPVPSPYSVFSPVVKKVSQAMPAGSSIHDFSDFA